jgi:deazaflavin-dependent oxidoreductase (nitroreductase family)
LPSRLAAHDPRRPPLRWILRAPLALYRLRLGWLLGGRFVELTVPGRRSGLPRRVVLEVLRRDPASGALWVASAWSERAEWFRNLVAHPRARVRSGLRQLEATAEVLDDESAARELARYARDHPLAYWLIGPLLVGGRGSGSPDEIAAVARGLRIVRLAPDAAGAARR